MLWKWYEIRKVCRIENYIKQCEYHIINKHNIMCIINKYHYISICEPVNFKLTFYLLVHYFVLKLVNLYVNHDIMRLFSYSSSVHCPWLLTYRTCGV